MFVVPLKMMSTALSQEDETNSNICAFKTTFTVDSEHQLSTSTNCDNGMISLDYDCTKPGFILGNSPLTDGKYMWKVQSGNTMLLCTVHNGVQ